MRALLLVLLLLAAGAAQAQPGVVSGRVHQPPDDPADGIPDFMALSGSLTSLLQLDRLGRTQAGPPATHLSSKSALYARIWLPQGLAVTGFFRLEPAPRTDPGDRILTDHTGWVDALYARWSLGTVSVFGGKIHPRFGIAWANAPGLYGNDIAADYELREKLGAGMRLWLSDMLGGTFGQHSLQAEVFTSDTSALSSGILARRFATPVTVTDPATGSPTVVYRRHFTGSHAVGGADNVDGMGGVVVSLAGVHVPLPGPGGELGYTLAWSSRRPGTDAAAAGRSHAEAGFAAGLFHSLPLGPDLQLLSLVDYVRHRNSGGFRAADAAWLTASTTLQAGPYTASLTSLHRRRDDPGSLRPITLREQVVSLSADLGEISGIPLLENLALAADWRRIDDAGRITQGIGAGLIWSTRF